MSENTGYQTPPPSTAPPPQGVPPSAADSMVSFTETVEMEGGGPVFVMLSSINMAPQRQMTQVASPYRAVQRGQAVGQFGYPIPPPPIWPWALCHAPKFKRIAPKQDGLVLTDFGITWLYEFESSSPLFGWPHVWLGG